VVAGLLRWLFDYTLKDALISWRYVELAGFEGFGGRLRIPTTPSRLAEMHPAELADIMEQLGTKERQRLINSLPVETAAEALEEVDPELQRAVIAQQDPGKAADILEEMSSTDAADVLRDLHASEAQVIISWMEREAQEDIRAILTHEEKSAGGVMSTACIETRPDQLAGEVLEHVRSVAGEAEVFNQIYVLDEGRHLLGVLSLRELLLAKTDAPLRTLMTTDVVSLDPDASLQAVAAIFVKYGFRAVPVVDKNNVFLGAIRLISVLSKLSRFFKGLTE
jgi:Mg/Co/Ni transporter MgtE